MHAPGVFVLVTFAAVLFGTPPAAAQPSFECSKATLAAERLVCASQTLSGLDEMLARSYTVAVGELGIAGTCLRTDQSRWLRTVRNACRDEACLTTAYRFRLAELNPFQPGITFVKDVPAGPELVAAVPPSDVSAADMPNNPDPKTMTADGKLSEEGGGYVLTTARGASYIVQNFYFNEVTIKRFNDVLVAADAHTRFRLTGFRAAISGNVFEARRCILVHRLPR
jgi:uncharacterized protein